MAPTSITADELVEIINVRSDLVEGPTRLNAAWLQNAGSSWSNPFNALEKINKLRFPSNYLLEHRALGGALALACSLDATVDISKVIVEAASSQVVRELNFAPYDQSLVK